MFQGFGSAILALLAILAITKVPPLTPFLCVSKVLLFTSGDLWQFWHFWQY